MANIAVINEPKKPIANNPYSLLEKLNSFLIKSNPVAAAIVGIAKRKENSTATFLLSPKNIPPMMVAAALDTPGIIEKD